MTAGAFRKAGLDVPENPAHLNAYRLSGCRGFPWSPSIDAHIGRRGGELLGSDQFACVDIDVAKAVDGSTWLDGFRRACDLAAESGSVLDLSGCITVRTPGHGSHGPGWHLWFRADPARQVRLGALDRCPLIEVKNRCSAPGSPGYVVRSLPDGELSILPSWLADLAGPPRPAVIGRTGRSDRTRERLEGVLSFLLEARPGDGRNARLFWASCRCAEMIAAGELDRSVAEQVLYRAAEECGHVSKHGDGPTRATIASGLAAVA